MSLSAARGLLCSEGLAFDPAEKEPPVIAHEAYYGIELLVYEPPVVADYCKCNNRTCFAVLPVNFGD